MSNVNRFNSDQLRAYMNKGVPLSHGNKVAMNYDQEDSVPDNQRKNLILPKMLPDVFSMSFYNSTKKKPANVDPSRAREESLDRYRGTSNNYYSLNKLSNDDDTIIRRVAQLRPGGAKRFVESNAMASGYGQFKKMGSIHENQTTQGGFFPQRPSNDKHSISSYQNA